MAMAFAPVEAALRPTAIAPLLVAWALSPMATDAAPLAVSL